MKHAILLLTALLAACGDNRPTMESICARAAGLEFPNYEIDTGTIQKFTDGPRPRVEIDAVSQSHGWLGIRCEFNTEDQPIQIADLYCADFACHITNDRMIEIRETLLAK